jgi:hypothetical protein
MGCSDADQSMNQSVVVELSSNADARDASACVDIAFKNALESEVMVSPWDVISDGELTGDLFIVRSRAGVTYPYTGKIVKGLPLEIGDEIRLGPAEVFRTTVCIGDYYQISGELGDVTYNAEISLLEIVESKILPSTFERWISNTLRF